MHRLTHNTLNEGAEPKDEAKSIMYIGNLYPVSFV
ncbi:hypothetical protein SBDP1_700008 [Syntrophobacter sp. SbD1]|nr:hypothetical protein SBDP1_700008 [Syntrophobacter sp. SbD1]